MNMIQRALSAAAGLVLAQAACFGQALKHEKFVLDNGLTVILHEDRRLPEATINLWYRVGAKNEPPGRSGFAHLFEHLMFMGTKRVPGNQFDVLMETGGGSNNASTSLDRTNYFSSGPSALLPTLLWLDADRMEDMGLDMNQDKLDKQRDVVRNELRQTVENRPYGKADEAVYQALYPVGHPYHFGVIGTHEDLEAASVTNVKDFFATFYVPNNCSLVVAGDFDSAAIKPLIKNLFGSLPRGNTPPKVEIPQPALTKALRSTHLDKVQLPRVAFYYHSPAIYAEGDAELSLLAGLLGDGPSSRLYKRLVQQEQLAVSVSAAQDGGSLGSVFSVQALVKPDADLAAVERIMDEEIAKLLTGELPADELSARQNGVELGLVASLQSIDRRADKLNEYEYAFGEPDSLQRDLGRYRSATPAKVQQWGQRVLKADQRLVQRVLPEKPERASSARDQRPAPSPESAFTPPAAQEARLACGARLLVYRQPALPLVSMMMLVQSPAPLDEPQARGRAALMASMLEEGTGNLDGAAFAQSIQALGASFGASADHDSVMVNLTGLKKTFPQAAALFASAVKAPRLKAEDFDRVKAIHIEDLKQADEEPRALTAKVSSLLLLGEKHPLAYPAGGTPEGCAGLTLEQIRTAHAALLRPEWSTIIIAGDLTLEEAKALLDKELGDWKAAGPAPAPAQADWSIPPAKGLRLFVIDRPGATQTMIHFRAPGATFADERRVAMELINTVLGQSFTSRLNANLRELHGYTYGAGSRMAFGKHVGVFTASSSVQAAVTGASLKEFMSEFARLRSGEKGDITADEALKASGILRTGRIQRFGSLSGTVQTAAELLEVGAPPATITQDLERAQALAPEQLNALCKTALRLDEGVLVLAGDRALILEQIKPLGLPEPLVIGADGKPAK
jgi:predicted Zn-dependent peptidase